MTAKKSRTFISIEIDPETKKAFSDKIDQEGKTVTSVLKQFIEQYLSSDTSENVPSLIEITQRLRLVEEKIQGISLENNELVNKNKQLVGESAA
ncbi:hypothetical protein G7B40_001555 [Aetokthonos hydrillicola Thurmond2011]|jgi:hypothetical protein|uniref:Uncharacterized protein n=1 Tax=Aetokthonos hydrillicola Thurmond2011 TaxID=2712845 RepID=A0AAP5I170_9CYAN|nr:hypothetical protein [Aetokthonos hydrillicola]MBO3463569.1 hypothetical protein [Aetokthonos hydrillicola CCALA 1050]MDR9893272.1 hypothetical protein [Aetokthonos hydrillicola Thurmond2011]